MKKNFKPPFVKKIKNATKRSLWHLPLRRWWNEINLSPSFVSRPVSPSSTLAVCIISCLNQLSLPPLLYRSPPLWAPPGRALCRPPGNVSWPVGSSLHHPLHRPICPPGRCGIAPVMSLPCLRAVELLAKQRLLDGHGVLEVVLVGIHDVGVAAVQLRPSSKICLRRSTHASRHSLTTWKRLTTISRKVTVSPLADFILRTSDSGDGRAFQQMPRSGLVVRRYWSCVYHVVLFRTGRLV